MKVEFDVLPVLSGAEWDALFMPERSFAPVVHGEGHADVATGKFRGKPELGPGVRFILHHEKLGLLPVYLPAASIRGYLMGQLSGDEGLDEQETRLALCALVDMLFQAMGAHPPADPPPVH